MSDDSMTSGRSKSPSLSTWLQAVTIAAVAGGAGVSKSAYDDLTAEVTASRIEAAQLRTVVEGLASQRDAAAMSAEVTRSQVQGLDLRLTALEVRAAALETKRR